MAPAMQMARRLESRQWTSRIQDTGFGRRDNSDDDDADGANDRNGERGRRNNGKDDGNVVATATPGREAATMDPTVVVPPEPSTSSSFSMLVPLGSLSNSSPRKGLDEAQIAPSVSSQADTSGATTTTGTALARSSSASERYGSYSDRYEAKQNAKKDETVEHILIGAGSIGIFIIICLVCFFGWRLIKRRRNRPAHVGGKLSEKMYSKMPWLPRSNNRAWQSLEDDDNPSRGMAALGRSHTNISAATTIQGSVVGYHGPGNKHTATDAAASTSGSTIGPNMNPNGAGFVAAGAGLVCQTSGTLSSTDPSPTTRSRMPDSFFNQSDLARQPSDAYDPTRMQVNRASELSSLSSGFGDSDILFPGAFVQQPPPSAPSLRQSYNLVGRFSGLSQGASTNRETVYTESSEDSPARFRTVDSWVTQQTGRVKRGQQRVENGEELPPLPDLPGAQPGAPGVPLATGMPVEHQYTMMMDFEPPKRPEKQE